MTGSFRAEERSFRVCRGGEGRPVATVMPVGGGGGSRVRGRESRGRRGGRGGVRERGREVRGVSGASRRKQEVARGKQEVAEASRARATPRLCLLAEEDDRGEWRWAGPCWAR